MTPKEFVKGFYQEKEEALNLYTQDLSTTAVGILIQQLNLSPEQMPILRQILDGVMTDTMYGILLGLDGAASIGGEQEDYQIFDEEGNKLTGGNIEGYAFEFFQQRQA
ncbi:MAG: hypothetical protein AAFO96_07945 [Bacteroidota bacterium]